jgi:hypothetical protein
MVVAISPWPTQQEKVGATFVAAAVAVVDGWTWHLRWQGRQTA